jgi:hypothetical protein
VLPAFRINQLFRLRFIFVLKNIYVPSHVQSPPRAVLIPSSATSHLRMLECTRLLAYKSRLEGMVYQLKNTTTVARCQRISSVAPNKSSNISAGGERSELPSYLVHPPI